MAILKNGLLGGVTGKLGNTVCYMLNGKQVVRMIVKSTKPPTERQLVNRAELALVNGFLKPIKELIKIGYASLAKARKTSEYSLALGYNKKHALMGEKPNREIDYSKVRISQGDLRGLQDLRAIINGNLLEISWATGHIHGTHTYDQVMTLVYYPSISTNVTPLALFNLCGVRREQGQMVTPLPEEMTGRTLEVYVFVVGERGKMVSNSEYLGRYQS